VARITGCFGIKGYLKVRLAAESAGRLKELGTVLLGKPGSECAPYEIEEVKEGGRNTLVKFRGVDDRTAAEPLSGLYLFVEETRRAKPKKGTYFIDDIIGCSVVTADGTVIGEIEDVHKFPGQDVWAVRRGTTIEMVPAVKEFIKDVDIKNRRIVVRPIEGLFGEA
jgi:16S rRNA processing protein RimM